MQRNLEALTHRGLHWPRARLLLKQHLGQQCYLAEELLTEEELISLRAELEIDRQAWSGYKWTFLHTAAAY